MATPKRWTGWTLRSGGARILGIVGHNGAGKSTLMRVVIGLTRCDSGSIEFDHERAGPGYSLAQSYARGVRIVFQELALCPSLRVFENVYLARPALRGRGWRRRSRQAIGQSLQNVFPGSRISARAGIGRLPLAQRQMVEIAQAVIGGEEEVRLLVLDEPTSALSREAADQLYEFLRRLRAGGVSTIVISHRMQEVLNNTDRTVVMRDGRVVGERTSAETTYDDVLALMGAATVDAAPVSSARRQPAGEQVLSVSELSTHRLSDVSFSVRRGEVVGIAGLDGQGQQDLLLELWRCRRRWRSRSVRCRGEMAFVTGDRQRAGVFSLWDLKRNASASAMSEISALGVLNAPKDSRWSTAGWRGLAIRGRRSSGIHELSGGTQQKVLVARALASQADVVLLDDPFRGVDVATKHDSYGLIREEADRGRAFIWFSTENAEFEECDRVFVLRGGRIAAELAGAEASEDMLIAASFGSGGQS